MQSARRGKYGIIAHPFNHSHHSSIQRFLAPLGMTRLYARNDIGWVPNPFKILSILVRIPLIFPLSLKG